MWPIAELYFWGFKGMSSDSSKTLLGYGILDLRTYLNNYVLKSMKDLDEEMLKEDYEF